MLPRLLIALLFTVMIPGPAWAVSVASFASRDDVTVGESFSVNVVVVNTQATAISDFRISVQRPSETGNLINLADATCVPSNCSAGAQIHWTQPNLAPGEVFTATFKTTLNTQANNPGTVVTFPIAVSGGGVSLGNSSLPVRSAGANAAATSQRLRLSSSTPVLAPGEEAVITATLGNSHDTNISFGNSLSITVPEGLALVEAIDGSANAQVGQWNIGAINPQTAQQRLLVVRSTGATPRAVTLSATLQSSEGSASARSVIALQARSALRVYIDTERTWSWNGGAVPVSIRVENHGSTPLPQVSLRARVPAGSGGARYASDTPTACASSCNALSEVVWNVGNLGAGASRSYTYRDIVASANSGASMVGEALRLEALAISSSGRAMASADVAVGTSGRLEVQVNPALPTFPIGQPVPIELIVGNWSTTAVSLGSELMLRLPAGLDVVAGDGAGIVSPGRLNWSLGAINPGDSVRRQIVVRADGNHVVPPWDGLFRNGFEAGSGTRLPAPLLAIASGGPGLASHTLRQHGSYTDHHNPLQVSVTIDPGSVAASDYVIANVVVSNTGHVDLFGTTAHLRVPAGNYWSGRFSDGGTGGGWTDAGQVLSWDIGQLAAGTTRSGSVTLRMRADVGSGLAQRYTAFARANNGLTRAESAELLTVRTPMQLELAAHSDSHSVQAGDPLRYTLSAGNTSGSLTSTATLRLVVPDGVTFHSASHGGSLSGNQVIWPTITLLPRHTQQRQVVFTVGAHPDGDQLKATVLLEDATRNLAHVDVVNHVETAPALKLAMATTASAIVPGGVEQTEITVANQGAVDLFGTVVQFRVPQENYWLGHASDAGTGAGWTDGGEFLTWNVGQLPAGASRTVSAHFRTRTNIAPGTVFSYDAWVRASNGIDRAATSSAILARDPRPLRLTMTTSHDAVQMGDSLVYTLHYGNTLTDASTPATLRMTVPDGLAFVSASDAGTAANGEVVWTLGNIPARQTGMRLATFTVADRPEGHLLKTTASVADSANHVAIADTVNHVETASALRMEVVMPPGPAAPNGEFSGSITVTNTDTVDLFGALVHLRVPAGNYWTGNLSDGGTGGGWTDGGEILNWNLGTLAAGQSKTVTVTLRLRADIAPGTVLPYKGWARASNGLDHARHVRVVRVHP